MLEPLDPPDVPADLKASLAAQDAAIVRIVRHGHKGYLQAASPGGDLFAWYSSRPEDAAVVEFEARVREEVGTEPPLRSPPLLERGRLWRLERSLVPRPLEGAEAVDTILAAAAAVSQLELPVVPPAAAGETRSGGFWRRMRTLVTPLPAIDFWRANTMLQASSLPRTMSHGAFDGDHVLLDGSVPWVIDWDQAASRPAGYDLMTMWAYLDCREDRDRLFEGALALVGERNRLELQRVRYAVTTKVVATMFADPDVYSRDPIRGRALLPLLAAARAEALDNRRS